MTRPAPSPVDYVRHQLHTHRRVISESTIVVATLLFLLLGAYIATTMLPTFR